MIVIRADANESIGSGHIMRCMSIAAALEKKGEQVVFATADHKGDRLLEQNCFEHICLESNWAELDNEVPAFRKIIKEYKPELILVDSYYVKNTYFRTLRDLVKIAYMDDHNERKWSVDYLINYNIYSTSLDYTQYETSETKLILGPSYAPLRDEFKGLPKHIIKKDIHDILVSAGGSDPEKITERIISSTCPSWLMVNFHFVIGALNPRIDSLKSLEKNNVILHINERNMSALMQKCDVAISAAGTTLYELCASGIPTITYTLADNQLIPAKEFERRGIMFCAGDCRDNANFTNNLDRLLKNFECKHRAQISNNMQNLVDGYGSNRIADELLEACINH